MPHVVELPPLPSNARYTYHPNECYDWGTFGWGIKTQGLDLTDEAALHQLRIAFKQLRYACEFLDPVLDRSQSLVFINMMKALQDQLGDIHDAAVQQEMLAVLPLAAHDELQEIVSQSQRNSQRLKKTLRQQIKRFNSITVPWQQLTLASESV